MKKAMVFIFTVVLLSAFAKVSFSEMRGENIPPSHGMGAKNITSENFSEAKAGILQKIEERLKRLNEEKVCEGFFQFGPQLPTCLVVRKFGHLAEQELSAEGRGTFM